MFYGFEFLCLGFIGWLYEIIVTLILHGRYEDRGMLDIPVCPIYGFCGFVLLFMFRKVKNPFYIFFGAAAVVTVIEYAASYVLETWFHLYLWDYYEWVLNLNGRVSLISSMIFGGLALLLIKVLHPLSDKICEKLPSWASFAVGLCSVLLIAVDLAAVIMR